MKREKLIGILIISVLFMWGTCLNSQTNIKGFSVINLTRNTITSVFISPSHTHNWGKNLMIKDKIITNESFIFIQPVSEKFCLYDIMFTDETGNSYIEEGLNLCINTGIVLQLPTR